VLAAANPRFGTYDDLQSTADQMDFETTILSRFDMIFLVRDIRDEERDYSLAKHMFSLHKVNRDPESPWFETEEDYPFADYPASAKGGPGYILPKHYVEHIIHDEIADRNLLRNEDKAVGVWVDRLAKRGLPVEYVNLPGTDGYEEHAESIVTRGEYKAYPHLLHHHLPGEAIRCMHKLDMEVNPELQVDKCFRRGT